MRGRRERRVVAGGDDDRAFWRFRWPSQDGLVSADFRPLAAAAATRCSPR
jgi:hypothetical protein